MVAPIPDPCFGKVKLFTAARIVAHLVCICPVILLVIEIAELVNPEMFPEMMEKGKAVNATSSTTGFIRKDIVNALILGIVASTIALVSTVIVYYTGIKVISLTWIRAWMFLSVPVTLMYFLSFIMFIWGSVNASTEPYLFLVVTMLGFIFHVYGLWVMVVFYYELIDPPETGARNADQTLTTPLENTASVTPLGTLVNDPQIQISTTIPDPIPNTEERTESAEL